MPKAYFVCGEYSIRSYHTPNGLKYGGGEVSFDYKISHIVIIIYTNTSLSNHAKSLVSNTCVCGEGGDCFYATFDVRQLFCVGRKCPR